jgi:hypothetical protein
MKGIFMSEQKSPAPAQAAAPAPKKKDERFKGVKNPAAIKRGAVVLEKLSKVNMSLPLGGAQMEKGKVVGLTQSDLDYLNAHHVEGYEDKFFDEVPVKKAAAPAPVPAPAPVEVKA